MTGRAQGHCALPASRPGYGIAYGRGRACGFGLGRGLGRGMGWWRTAAQGTGREGSLAGNDRRGLQEEAAALEAELQRIRQRIDELG